MAARNQTKNFWILLILLLAGIVLGNFIAYLTKDVTSLSFLQYGYEFGLKDPLFLDLEMIQMTFGISFKITISSILGIAIAIFAFRKL